jgi:hypothetical protein
MGGMHRINGAVDLLRVRLSDTSPVLAARTIGSPPFGVAEFMDTLLFTIAVRPAP